MTMGNATHDTLNYRLTGSLEPIGSWGHEYVRHLALELVDEYQRKTKQSEAADVSELHGTLVEEITTYHMSHNAEAEAVDLLMELDKLDNLIRHVDEHSQPRVSLYLISCVPYAETPDDRERLLRVALQIYVKFSRNIEALRTAILINDMRDIKEIFFRCPDPLEQKQMAIIMGRQQVFLDVPSDVPQSSDLGELVSNSSLSRYFLQLARELDIMEPKTPEDIYKTHLEPSRPFGTTAQVDSARQNLANTLVNAFVNCGFQSDKLISEDANRWFYKNKDHGMFTAAASQGLLWRWDVDEGLTVVDKYLYSNDDFIKAGNLLAIGIISSGVQHECDPAAALLLDYVRHEKPIHRIGSILGLGLAYANSSRESVESQVLPALEKVLTDPKSTPEVLGVTGLALGFICIGTGNADIAQQIWSILEDRPNLNDANYRYLALAIGLIYLGHQEGADIMMESLEVLKAPFRQMALALLKACAYAGTGDVIQVQKLMHICFKNLTSKEEKDKKDDKKSSSGAPEGWLEQAVAVLGVALIGMAEDVGSQMTFRTFGHLLRYGEVWIRRAVPLALALSSASNPQLNILETLSKFSHDSDPETAYNAIFAMGIVGAGTNNARLATMLRQLAAYHQRDSLSLFLVRVAQGLVHMGKGTLTLHPYHFDRQLLCLPALGALIATCFAFLDAKNWIQPRMLITFIEEESGSLKQVNVSVRVGQAVDVVGQAGKPKTITGFQTHTTPVLLGYGERAELATEEYLIVSPVLEGFVILRKNPEYKAS